MLPKPNECVGCPLYGDGQGFVPDAPVSAEVAILAQNPGADEEAGRQIIAYSGKDRIYGSCPLQPLTGPTGFFLNKDYIPKAGLSLKQVSRHNLLKCRHQVGAKKVNTLPPKAILDQAVEHCTRAFLRIPPSVKVIVAHGAPAFEWTQGHAGFKLGKWRGYIAPNRVDEKPVFATLHTASLFRSPKWKLTAYRDWVRVRQYLDGKWPQPWPTRVHSCPSEVSLTQARDILISNVQRGTPMSLDTEFDYREEHVPGQHRLTVLGLGWRGEGGEFELLQVDLQQDEGGLLAELAEPVRALVGAKLIFQNKGADLPVLEHNLGIPREAWTHAEDLMLVHALLYSDQPHTLEHLASIRGVLPKYTHLLDTDKVTKNQGDLVETLVCFEHFYRELEQDPALLAIYRTQSLPLVNIHTRATEAGIPINKPRVLEALNAEIDTMRAGLRMAQAYVGFPFNAGSPGENGQVATVLYKHCGLKPVKDRKTKKASVGADAIMALRQKVGPEFDHEEEERKGLTVDTALARCEEDGNPVLEGRVLYAKALQNISHYLVPLIRMPS